MTEKIPFIEYCYVRQHHNQYLNHNKATFVAKRMAAPLFVLLKARWARLSSFVYIPSICVRFRMLRQSSTG